MALKRRFYSKKVVARKPTLEATGLFVLAPDGQDNRLIPTLLFVSELTGSREQVAEFAEELNKVWDKFTKQEKTT